MSLSEDVDGISCSARFNNDDVAVPFAKLPLHPGTDGQPVLDMAALGRSFGKTQYKVNGMVCTKSAVLSSPVVET